MDDTVRKEVRRLIEQLAPVRDVDISPSTELGVDLGYESLRLMELATAIEDHFKLDEITEDDAAEADTVGEVEDLVVRLLNEQHVGSEA
ncbi:MAG TPA: acyl carrier protein [Solirubrobacterales bacterium]|nr:acyl carrier protein [Solirubrobacterales bacterium]